MSNKLQAKAQTSKQEIYQLLQSLPIDPELTTLCLADIKSLEENNGLQEIYLMYPRLFASLFFDEKEQEEIAEALSRLCLAGFFIYRFVVKSDQIFDRNSLTFNNQDLLAAFAYQEEGVRLLSTIFDYESSFWGFWNRRKKELAQAVALDSTIDELDWDLYEILADCKSTFGKIAIDAIHLMKGERELNDAHQKILDSHRYYSVGFQILDDIQDFERDLSVGQSNIGIMCLADRMAVPYRSLFEESNKKAICREFISKGLDQQLYERAESYFSRSEKEVSALAPKIPLWMEVIRLKRKQALQLRKII